MNCRRDCRNISSQLSNSCGSRTSSGLHRELNARANVDTPTGGLHFLPGLHNPEGLLRAIGSWLHLRPAAPAWGMAAGVSHGDAQDHRVLFATCRRHADRPRSSTCQSRPLAGSKAVRMPPRPQPVSMHTRCPRLSTSPSNWGVWPTMAVFPE